MNRLGPSVNSVGTIRSVRGSRMAWLVLSYVASFHSLELNSYAKEFLAFPAVAEG